MRHEACRTVRPRPAARLSYGLSCLFLQWAGCILPENSHFQEARGSDELRMTAASEIEAPMECSAIPPVVLLFCAFDNHPIGLDFSVFSNSRFALTPLLPDTDLLPDGHASVPGGILSPLKPIPESQLRGTRS